MPGVPWESLWDGDIQISAHRLELSLCLPGDASAALFLMPMAGCVYFGIHHFIGSLLLAVKSGAHLLETFTAQIFVVVALGKLVLPFLRLFHPFMEGGLSCFHLDLPLLSSLHGRENRNRLTQIMLLKSLLQV